MSKTLHTYGIKDELLFNELKSAISKDSLVKILSGMVDVASPTGEEGPLARSIVDTLNEFDLNGVEQKIDAMQSNAYGTIKGIGENSSKNSLMFYAPIDTVTSNSRKEDLPWAGDEMQPEMIAKSSTDGKLVYGLGAHNPKGHAACIIEAARVLKKIGVPLQNDLIVAFGAGGMPTNHRKGTRVDSGHGAGCDYLLNQIPNKPSAAVIAKSGWSVSYEEVGLIWFEVRVKGIHNYSGARHLMPYKNPITDAAKLIEKLDEWLKEWPEKHRTGLVAPQGVISFIESGWERMPSFTPAVCRFRIDLRISPRTTLDEAENEFSKVLKNYSDELGIESSYERLVGIPGTNTHPEHRIILSTIDSWKAITGKKHEFVTGLSGATDANILRTNGVPTARIGLPKASLEDINFQKGMNTVEIEHLYQLTLLLVHLAITYER